MHRGASLTTGLVGGDLVAGVTGCGGDLPVYVNYFRRPAGPPLYYGRRG